MPSIQELLFEIRHLNDETNIQRWTTKGLTSLTPETLEKAIMDWQDPLLLVGYLNLEHPLARPAVWYFLRTNWDRIKPVFQDKMMLYDYISKDQKKKELLDTERGREWLTYVRKRCYVYFYKYAWG
jgi:hypothetical protein